MAKSFYFTVAVLFCLMQISFASRQSITESNTDNCTSEPAVFDQIQSRNISHAANQSTNFGSADSLRILSYNIKGLPPVATPGWGQERFVEIARQLNRRLLDGSAPDVVLLQEVFTRNAQEVISLSGYPYWVHGPTRNGQDSSGCFQKTYSSGIYILSRYPILESGYINYNKSDCATWDCYSNKGLQYAIIKVPAQKYPSVIFNTHMQAGADYDEERSRQIETLKSFVSQKFLNQGLFFFGGDFNTNPSRASYHKLKRELNALNAGQFCTENTQLCKILENTEHQEIHNSAVDHVFYYNRYRDISVTPVEIQRNFKDKFLDQHLSDHFGLEVLFQIK